MDLQSPLPPGPVPVRVGVACNMPGATVTFTLHLPAGAQALSPGERPFGSMAKIDSPAPEEADGVELDALPPAGGDALLTITF